MKAILRLSLLFVCVLICQTNMQAQQSYQPLKSDSLYNHLLLEETEKRLQYDIAKLSGPLENQFAEVYEQRYYDLHAKINARHFVSDERLNPYFQEIFQHLLASNPELNQPPPRLLISRYPQPNASCLGEGTIALNLGLIHKLQNEGQVAFVLSHELAHHYLNHVNKAIARHIEAYNSNYTRKRLKKASKQKYNQKAEAIAVLKNLAYQQGRHSRQHEKSADSLALHFLQKSRYSPSHSISTLTLLDTIDRHTSLAVPDLKSTFHAEAYPFKEEWLMDEQNLSFGFNQINEFEADSLKTHPDCTRRINWVKEEISSLSSISRQHYIADSSQFNKLKAICQYELIESEYQLQRYSRSLYLALAMLQSSPEQSYLHTVVNKSLYQIYQAQKNHTFNEFVDMPSPYFTDGYNQLLNFVANLRLSEIARVAFHYAENQSRLHHYDEEFLYSYILCSRIAGIEPSDTSLKDLYKKQFPNGKYLKQINQN